MTADRPDSVVFARLASALSPFIAVKYRRAFPLDADIGEKPNGCGRASRSWSALSAKHT